MNFCRRIDGYNETDLLHSAIDHLKSAKILFDQNNPICFDSGGYLCHLGVELILKACHLHHFDVFPKTHILNDLVQGLSEKGFALSVEDSVRIDDLDKFIKLRYPNPKDPVSVGNSDWARTETLVRAILKQLPSDLSMEISDLSQRFISSEKGKRILHGQGQ